MFDTVLVANRGEIALRVIRTLRALGVRSVAVYSAADAAAPHVAAADLAVRLPHGYLDTEAILAAARRTGAQAVHPGYGFLAENASFARACAEAGLAFVGPPPEAVEAMGDKIRAKETVARAGVPVVPGADGDLSGWSEFPALIKPSAGGGGKGMVLVRSAAELPEAVESARRTALAAFGDGTLLIERYVENPRHIEIQVMADTFGQVVHLGERECSLQRRHQKIIEEAPSPFLDPATREAMGSAALEAARAVGYVGAGTVEFIVPGGGAPGEFFFMEMNTRLQVEHPVTEMVARVRGVAPDLVELQLRVAAGEPLGFAQGDVGLFGHAVEARVYAEDPARGFLPTGGRILTLREPSAASRGDSGWAVRVDSGITEGMVVGSDYDPMLSKVIAWSADRGGALRTLRDALADTVLLGVPTNISFLRALLAHPAVVAGDLDTGLVERHLDELIPKFPDKSGMSSGVPGDVLAVVALHTHPRHEATGDPWGIADGWRLGERAWTRYRLESGGRIAEVRIRSGLEVTEVEVDGVVLQARLAAGDKATVDGVTRRYVVARDGAAFWVAAGGETWGVTLHRVGDPGDRPGGSRSADGVVRSPMPGTVLVVKVGAGERVEAGQALVVVEAMKMEHTVTAPLAGVVATVPVRAGQQVAMDAVLATVTPEEA